MLGLATTRQVKGERVLTDYQHDVMYDYVDEVEVNVNEYTDESIEEVYSQLAQDREAMIASVMALAVALKVKPEALAKVLTTINLSEYTNKVNDEIEKLKAQKTKAVKTK